MENLVRIHILPPQFVPGMPQVMILQKLNQRERSRPSPCLINQAQDAEQNQDSD